MRVCVCVRLRERGGVYVYVLERERGCVCESVRERGMGGGLFPGNYLRGENFHFQEG